jgi:hypothetical protein
LFATATAKAGLVEFVVDTSKSTLKQVDTLDLTGLFKVTTIPQVGSTTGFPLLASDTAPVAGSMFVDYDAVSFQINPGGTPAGAMLSLLTTGVYSPHDPVTSLPDGTGVSPGHYGQAAPGVLLTQVWYGFKPTISMPIGGPNAGADLTGLTMPLIEGWGASYLGALATGTNGSIAGFGYILGTGGTATATLIGDVLTIPVNSLISIPITSMSVVVGSYTTAVSGTIVATPKIPEPSTMVLLGFGVVGLLTCAWRARRRKA